tara:strand:+ start:42 stop:545 length:504 start_codon:yes stop_codon:yes gene_type:complete
MSNNPKLIKNGGKGTLFGNLLRGAISLGSKISPNIIGVIANATGLSDVPIIEDLLKKENLEPIDMEFLLAKLDADKTEMEEITKRWEADSLSDSWLSKNVRPLSLAFLTLALFIYIILDSSIDTFTIKESWIDLLSSLLLLVYSGYFGARALEKITKMRESTKRDNK